jgi:hypothetical protein
LITTIGLRENRRHGSTQIFYVSLRAIDPTPTTDALRRSAQAQLRLESAAKSLIKTVFITIDQPFGSRSGNAVLADTNGSDEHR